MRRPMWRTLARAGCAAALAVVAGCGGDGDGSAGAAATAALTPTATAAPTATPAPARVRSARVVFRTPGGRRVSGDFTPAGRHAPALVLLHQLDGGPDQWDPYAPVLHAAGFATLAYAARRTIAEADRLPELAGALRWLRRRRDVDGARIGLVGASIGASTTALAMTTRTGRGVRAAVALSPPDSSDIWDLQDSGRYRPHDVLFIADPREYVTVEGYLDGAVRSRGIEAGRPGHGVALLPDPAISSAVVDWLRARVG
jgi:BAAT / Acyl-CoA thioester hydrolase C terminal